jgi:hypothetical protein
MRDPSAGLIPSPVDVGHAGICDEVAGLRVVLAPHDAYPSPHHGGDGDHGDNKERDLIAAKTTLARRASSLGGHPRTGREIKVQGALIVSVLREGGGDEDLGVACLDRRSGASRKRRILVISRPAWGDGGFGVAGDVTSA